MYLSPRTASAGKILGVGFLGLGSMVALVIGGFLALMMWLPFSWALKVVAVPNLDIFRIFYASAYTVVVPMMLALSVGGLVGSVILARKFNVSKGRIVEMLAVMFVIAFFIGSAVAPSTMAISASQTAIYSQFYNLPCTYYVFTDGTYYYAQNCATGAIDYGGPNSNGGASGTSFSSVYQIALNVIAAAGNPGVLTVAPGIYTQTAQISLGGTLAATYQKFDLNFMRGAQITYTGSGFAFKIASNTVAASQIFAIENLDIYTTTGSGIEFGNSSYFTLTNPTIYTNQIGIWLADVCHVGISGPTGELSIATIARATGSIGLKISTVASGGCGSNSIQVNLGIVTGFDIGVKIGDKNYVNSGESTISLNSQDWSNTNEAIDIFTGKAITISGYFELNRAASVEVNNTGTNVPTGISIVSPTFLGEGSSGVAALITNYVNGFRIDPNVIMTTSSDFTISNSVNAKLLDFGPLGTAGVNTLAGGGLANPFCTASAKHAAIGIGCTNPGATSKTVYTDEGFPVIFSCSGGTGVSMVYGPQAYSYACADTFNLVLPIGWTINITFATPPTFYASIGAN